MRDFRAEWHRKIMHDFLRDFVTKLHGEIMHDFLAYIVVSHDVDNSDWPKLNDRMTWYGEKTCCDELSNSSARSAHSRKK